MSKKRIGLSPTHNNFYLEKEKVIITGIKDENSFVYKNKYKAVGILPFDRFMYEEECSKVQINSEVIIYRYFTVSSKKLLAYHVRHE